MNAAKLHRHTQEHNALGFSKGFYPLANTVVVFGDSRTAKGGNFGATPYDLKPRGYWVWANILLGQRLEIVNYAGSSGDTTTQMLARFSEDVLAYAPGWLFVWGANNDIATDVPTDTITANLQLMYEGAKARGIKVVAFTETPRTTSTPAQRAATLAVNQWVKNNARADDNIILIDAFALLIDAESATVQPKAGVFYDSTHPSPKGAFIVGDAVKAALIDVVPETPSATSSVIDNYDYDAAINNGLSVGLMQGAAGTNSSSLAGSVPDGWTLTEAGTPTGTVTVGAPASSGAGNSVDLAISPSSASDAVTLTADASAQGGATIGDEIWLECDIEVSGTGTSLDTVKGVTCEILGDFGGDWQARALAFDTAEAFANADFTGRIRTQKVPITLALGHVLARVTAYFTGADAGTVTIKISNVAVMYA